MASRKTQERLAASVKARAAKETLTETIERKAAEAPRPTEHEQHLAAMQALVVEVAQMRAILAAGFDKLVAHLLDEAVAEAAEATPAEVEMLRTGKAPAEPEPPAEDASKKHLAPAHPATLDDVREALNAYTRVHGLAEASKVVQGLGVKRLTELPPERYAEAVAAFKE